ncbi:MAG: response regulator [Clostridia bacterium]|nr:response regulator [Clostridia bacterium]
MHVLLVDDEYLNLCNLEEITEKLLSHDTRVGFTKASQAMKYIEENTIDLAFLDIEMRGINGINIAQSLREKNPRVNVIFCTGYSEYALDAWDLDCSGYLLKPITEEKVRHALENLRYTLEKPKRVYFHCFGNFEAYCDGNPITFKYKRTKEFLAYLVDRNGASCSLKELSAALFEDEEHRSYIYQIRLDLINTLESLGVEDIIIQARGHMGIVKDKVSCDYYDYMDGGETPSVHEYMAQYSFAELTSATLFGQR